MFGQLIDILIKHDSDRQNVIFFLLKILFTATLTTHFYELVNGPFFIISITSFTDIVNYFIRGEAIICFGLFYLTWTISYDILSVFLSILAFWISSKIYEGIYILINNSHQLSIVIENDKSLQKWIRRYTHIFNMVDIIEIENNEVKSGRQFYKFYDYLIDIDKNTKSIAKDDFINVIALCLQFIVLYNLLDLNFLTVNWWILSLTFLIINFLIFSAFMAYVLATMIEIKHGRLLKLMNKIEPDYYSEHEIEKESVQSDTVE